MVYVLNKDGKPIMPTTRHGKVRRLLKEGKAHVVSTVPFTIQLNYISGENLQEINLGVDTGSRYIGLSASTSSKELYAAQVELRSKEIPDLILSRRESRRTRRNRKTRYRKPRFDNRKRPNGWLTPTSRNRFDEHMKAIQRVYKILPVSNITIEIAPFDTQKLKNPGIQGEEYQHGELFGFENAREYALIRDRHECQHCHGKSGCKTLHVHHIQYRSQGGTDAVGNLITLCEDCHNKLHNGEFELNLKKITSFKNQTSVSTIGKPVFWKAKELYGNVKTTYGYITKTNRLRGGIEKSHTSDAFVMAGNLNADRFGGFYQYKLNRRHTRSLHKQLPKKGGIRAATTATHTIGNSGLQKGDLVLWNGMKCFISGSSHNRLYLKDINGNLLTRKQNDNGKMISFTVRTADVKFLRRMHGSHLLQFTRE